MRTVVLSLPRCMSDMCVADAWEQAIGAMGYGVSPTEHGAVGTQTPCKHRLVFINMPCMAAASTRQTVLLVLLCWQCSLSKAAAASLCLHLSGCTMSDSFLYCLRTSSGVAVKRRLSFSKGLSLKACKILHRVHRRSLLMAAETRQGCCSCLDANSCVCTAMSGGTA